MCRQINSSDKLCRHHHRWKLATYGCLFQFCKKKGKKKKRQNLQIGGIMVKKEKINTKDGKIIIKVCCTHIHSCEAFSSVKEHKVNVHFRKPHGKRQQRLV